MVYIYIYVYRGFMGLLKQQPSGTTRYLSCPIWAATNRSFSHIPKQQLSMTPINQSFLESLKHISSIFHLLSLNIFHFQPHFLPSRTEDVTQCILAFTASLESTMATMTTTTTTTTTTTSRDLFLENCALDQGGG